RTRARRLPRGFAPIRPRTGCKGGARGVRNRTASRGCDNVPVSLPGDLSGVPDEAFPILDPAEIAVLEPMGTRRAVAAGDFLYRAGDAAYDFYVLLAGRVEIFVTADGEERHIVDHGPGSFLGELNLITGLRVFLSARVAEAGEVLVLPSDALRRVVAIQPRLS